MDTKTTLSISDARKNIFKISDDVKKTGRYYTLTENGKPKAVIMSALEFESWAETLEIMREIPSLNKDILETRHAVKTGQYKKWPTLKYDLSSKGKT
jgi:prevent-host-death family protein